MPTPEPELPTFEQMLAYLLETDEEKPFAQWLREQEEKPSKQ